MIAWFRLLTAPQRLSWATCLVAFLICALAVSIPLYNQYKMYTSVAERNANTIASLRFLASSRESLNQALKAFDERDFKQWLYPVGKKETQTALNIQKRVTQIITDNSAALVSASVLKSKSQAEYLEPGVKVDFQGSMESILLTLQDLEDSRPVLVIDKLIIRPKRQRRRKSEATEIQELTVQLEARSFIPLPEEER